MCQRLSLPMLDTPATSYIGALEARREIETVSYTHLTLPTKA